MTTPAITEPQKPTTPLGGEQPEKLDVHGMVDAMRSMLGTEQLPSVEMKAAELARALRVSGKSAQEVINAIVDTGATVDVAKAALRSAIENPTAPAAAAAAEAAPNPLVVTLDDDVEIQLPDAETASLAQQSMLRSKEYREGMAAVEEQLANVQQLKDSIVDDAAAVLTPWLAPQPPERVADLARHLLALPGVREAVEADQRQDAELLAGLNERERQAEVRNDRMVEARQYKRDLLGVVERLTVGANMAPEAREVAELDIVRDVAALVRRNGDRPIPFTDLPKVLASRFKQLGITPEVAAAAFASSAPPTLRSRSPVREPNDQNRDTGRRLVAASQARRLAAAVPGAGAGAQPARAEPPPQQGIKERLAWLRERVLGR